MKEIEIPEGYEARIEGNKVIIELKESEDERIRGYVILVVKDWWRKIAEVTDDGKWPTEEEMLVYLEKQKEQKQYDIDVLEKHITKDSVSELAHTVIIRNGWEIVEASKQKQEWSDSVAKEMFIKALERAAEQTKKGYELTDCDKHSWWEDFKACSEIKFAEWSEEDKQSLLDLIEFIENWQKQSKTSTKIYTLWTGDVIKCNRLLSFLKSLRPQPHREPSKEQEVKLQVALSCIQGILEAKHGILGEIVPSLAVAESLRIADEFVKQWFKDEK